MVRLIQPLIWWYSHLTNSFKLLERSIKGDINIPFLYMLMNLHLYKTNDDPRKVSKELTSDVFYEGIRFIDNVSIDNPTIYIDITGFEQVGDISQFNYMYIPSLNRYYFITNITFSQNKIFITGECDALMSYKSQILNSTQLVTRQENLNNRYLVDSKLPIYSKVALQMDENCIFNSGWDKSQNSYIITISAKP